MSIALKDFCADLPHQGADPTPHAIVDDDVEVAPIYRGRATVEKSVRYHENHDLHMEWEAMMLESHCKPPVNSSSFSQIISHLTKIQGM